MIKHVEELFSFSTWMDNLILLLFTISVILIVRIFWVLPIFFQRRKRKTNNSSNKDSFKLSRSKVRTLIVLGSGGHTTEMFYLLKSLDLKKYSPRVYVIAETDVASTKMNSKLKAIEFEKVVKQ